MKGGPRVTPPARPSPGRMAGANLTRLPNWLSAWAWMPASGGKFRERMPPPSMTRSRLHVRHVAFKLMESNEGRSFVPPRHRVVLER